MFAYFSALLLTLAVVISSASPAPSPRLRSFLAIIRSPNKHSQELRVDLPEHRTNSLWDLEIPKFCTWPSPDPLSHIAPTFLVRIRGGNRTFVIDDENQLEPMVTELSQQGLVMNRVIFLVHGYADNIRTPWLRDVSDALLAVEDSTVIAIGWGKGADIYTDYCRAAANTQVVAGVLARATTQFRALHTPPSTYCIGHSLGAHICGQAGRESTFDRITGLDPAGPGFQDCPTNPGLNSSSARCVDVLHTNGAEFGRMDPVGHIDFYPNCGRFQPGCKLIRDIACNHDKAIDYYLQSIGFALDTTGPYPMALGSCDDTFPIECQPCHLDKCPSEESNCQKVRQPVGYRSPCDSHGGEDEQFYGNWFVTVDENGFTLLQ